MMLFPADIGKEKNYNKGQKRDEGDVQQNRLDGKQVG